MTTIDEASSLLRAIAEPRPIGDTIKTAITRAARRVTPFLPEPMSYGRAEDLWRREARRVDAYELDAIRSAKAKRDADHRAECRSVAAIAARLERVAAAFEAGEAGVDADQLRRSAREARRAAAALRRVPASGLGA